MEKIISEINNFLEKQAWCDFNIIEFNGKLKVGGKTSFNNEYDIIIVFEEIFYFQCLFSWQTDTSYKSFLIPEIEEQRDINIKYGIEQGYSLFKIIPEDIEGSMYISAKNIYIEYMR
ncbi:MAG: hypothetical protein LBV71_07070 [Prevotella sp.]|jgi:hypothetical protein|nr:hypothetical protein [Prevotella sp.]